MVTIVPDNNKTDKQKNLRRLLLSDAVILLKTRKALRARTPLCPLFPVRYAPSGTTGKTGGL